MARIAALQKVQVLVAGQSGVVTTTPIIGGVETCVPSYPIPTPPLPPLHRSKHHSKHRSQHHSQHRAQRLGRFQLALECLPPLPRPSHRLHPELLTFLALILALSAAVFPLV